MAGGRAAAGEDGGVPELVARLREEIERTPGRRITFARFMERALTEPGLGYYATSEMRPTREGDFLTAPELHPFFGRVVGRQLDEMWQRLDRPVPFVVREYGSGRGTLAATIRAGLVADGSALAHALEHQAVELGGEPAAAGPIMGCILANEYLDALPVHRVAQRDGRLLEVFVTWADDRFVDLEDEPSTPALAAHLAADGMALAEGQRAEIGLAAARWTSHASGDLERGYVLVIDYGHEAQELYGPQRMAGTLLGYRGHALEVDPYAALGRTDLTAHVDVTALHRTAGEAGLLPAGDMSQARFVAALGLGELLAELGADPATDPRDYLAARSCVIRLIDPRHLGAFRVVAWTRGAPVDPPLRGFR